jgi:hypothetical protein
LGQKKLAFPPVFGKYVPMKNELIAGEVVANEVIANELVAENSFYGEFLVFPVQGKPFEASTCQWQDDKAFKLEASPSGELILSRSYGRGAKYVETRRFPAGSSVYGLIPADDSRQFDQCWLAYGPTHPEGEKVMAKIDAKNAAERARQDAAYYERQALDDACWQDRCQWSEWIDSTLATRGQKPYALVKRALARVPESAHWLVDEKARAKWPLTFGRRAASETV